MAIRRLNVDEMCDPVERSTRPRILAAVDGSQQSAWAAEVAVSLAEVMAGRIALVHAYSAQEARPGYSPQMGRPIEEILDQLKQGGQGILRRQRLALSTQFGVEEILTEGDAARQIVAVAGAWGADLIVMGSHGRGRLGLFLIGSTADAVIRKAHCPVLCVAHEPPKCMRRRDSAWPAAAAEIVSSKERGAHHE